MANFDIPEPKKIAPDLTIEQRQAMAPIDLLVQYVMPKLWDKVNYLEWAMKSELHDVRDSLDFIQRYVDKISADTDNNILRLSERVSELERSFSSPVPQVNDDKPKRTRKKKEKPLDSEPKPLTLETDIEEPVQLTRIATYDPDIDNWVPKVVADTEITASVIDMVAAGNATYSTDVTAFIYDLSDSERKVLCEMFPDEK